MHAVRELLSRFLLTIPFGALVRFALWRPGDGWLPGVLTTGLAAMLMSVIAAGELFLPAGYPDTTEMVLGAMGAAVGCAVANAFARCSMAEAQARDATDLKLTKASLLRTFRRRFIFFRDESSASPAMSATCRLLAPWPFWPIACSHTHIPEVCSQQISGVCRRRDSVPRRPRRRQGATRPTHRCPFRASFFGRVCYFARRIVGELQ